VDIRREANPAALLRWFEQIIEAAEPAEVIERASLQHPDMAPLKAALAAARARAGTAWPRVPEIQGRILEPGATDPARVPPMRQRLALSDPVFAANPGEGPVYDERLQAAVRRFQAERGIDPTGRVGPVTVAALNRPVEAGVNQLRAALDMRRGVAAPARERRVEVNVPDFRLAVIEEGRVIMDMAVVVGRPARATPMIVTRMTSVQFNPPWGVPQRNAREDLLPRLQRDPTSLQARGFRIFQRVDGQVVEVDPTTVNWRAVATPTRSAASSSTCPTTTTSSCTTRPSGISSAAPTAPIPPAASASSGRWTCSCCCWRGRKAGTASGWTAPSPAGRPSPPPCAANSPSASITTRCWWRTDG
jgi:murein L,D-transpeptidase YcbB/YkuD